MPRGAKPGPAVDDARDRLAALLGAKPHELIFTGSGTESNNLAVLGIARAQARPRSPFYFRQHRASRGPNAFEHLSQREGFDVTFLPVDGHGRIDPEELAARHSDRHHFGFHHDGQQ